MNIVVSGRLGRRLGKDYKPLEGEALERFNAARAATAANYKGPDPWDRLIQTLKYNSGSTQFKF